MSFLSETRKAWLGFIVALLMPAATYAATADWAAWGVADWRGVFNALLSGFVQALAIAGVVYAAPNKVAKQ